MNRSPAAERLAAARTFLFVPGDRPDRFPKAVDAGPDMVVLDLEDAVAPDRKEEARASVVRWLAAGRDAVVRVNASGTRWHAGDVQQLAALAAALMIPKAETREDWSTAAGCLILPLVETARGLVNAAVQLDYPEVVRPAFGSMDFAAEIGVDPDDRQAMQWARSSLVVAAATAGKAGPVDGVTTALDDEAALVTDVTSARALGMTAKLCIHPAQIRPVHALLQPSEAEVDWAHRVLAATQVAVAVVDGRMVDAPVLARARRIVSQASV